MFLVFTHTRVLLACSLVHKHEEFIYVIIKPDEISNNRILFHVIAIRSESAPIRCSRLSLHTFFNCNEFHCGTPTHPTKEAIHDLLIADRCDVAFSSWFCEFSNDSIKICVKKRSFAGERMSCKKEANDRRKAREKERVREREKEFRP